MTNCKPITAPFRSRRCGQDAAVRVPKCVHAGRGGVETVSGFALQKLRLELAPSVSDAFTMFNSVGANI